MAWILSPGMICVTRWNDLKLQELNFSRNHLSWAAAALFLVLFATFQSQEVKQVENRQFWRISSSKGKEGIYVNKEFYLCVK